MTDIFDFEGWYDDFELGVTYAHARGKTIDALDNVLLTNMVINTAEPHFNEHAASLDPMFKHRIVYGGINVAMVVGLSAQDTARHAIREIGMDKVRLHAPVYHGDTLYAFSEVIGLEPVPGEGGGIVTFRHSGFNQDETLIFSGERRVLIRARAA